MSGKIWKEIYDRVRSRDKTPESTIEEGSLTEDIEDIRMETRIFVAGLLESRHRLSHVCHEDENK